MIGLLRMIFSIRRLSHTVEAKLLMAAHEEDAKDRKLAQMLADAEHAMREARSVIAALDAEANAGRRRKRT